MEFELVDAMDPAGASRLAGLGRAVLPVLARDSESIVAVDLQKIAEFTGISRAAHAMLPAETLVGKWIDILRAAATTVCQFPDALLASPIVPGSDRSIRIVSHHLFRIAESFLETAIDGAPLTLAHTEKKLAPDEFNSGGEFEAYAEAICKSLSAWIKSTDSGKLLEQVETYYGPQSLHELLERSTWHSAQHTRQIEEVLGNNGIAPTAKLGEELLAGLPIPKGIWV